MIHNFFWYFSSDLRGGVFPIVSHPPMVPLAHLCPILAVLPWPEFHSQTKVRRNDSFLKKNIVMDVTMNIFDILFDILL
jgi:hypothetical protein